MFTAAYTFLWLLKASECREIWIGFPKVADNEMKDNIERYVITDSFYEGRRRASNSCGCLRHYISTVFVVLMLEQTMIATTSLGVLKD